MTQPITSPSPARGVPFPPAADPVALLRAQQRLFGACARSGLILGEAARDCAERQVAIGRAAMRELWAAAPAATRGGPARAAADWLAGLAQELGAGLEAMQRTLLEAQLAILEELRRAVAAEPAAGVETEAGATVPAAAPAEAKPKPVPSTAEPASIGAEKTEPAPVAEAAPAAAGEAVVAEAAAPAASAADGGAPERSGEASEPARPRRSRRVSAAS